MVETPEEDKSFRVETRGGTQIHRLPCYRRTAMTLSKIHLNSVLALLLHYRDDKGMAFG